MKVTDMVNNADKTAAENYYIAETKFKYHQQGDLSFEEIRSSLNNTYGGFDKEGWYYHKPGTFDPKPKPPPLKPSSTFMPSIRLQSALDPKNNPQNSSVKKRKRKNNTFSLQINNKNNRMIN